MEEVKVMGRKMKDILAGYGILPQSEYLDADGCVVYVFYLEKGWQEKFKGYVERQQKLEYY